MVCRGQRRSLVGGLTRASPTGVGDDRGQLGGGRGERVMAAVQRAPGGAQEVGSAALDLMWWIVRTLAPDHRRGPAALPEAAQVRDFKHWPAWQRGAVRLKQTRVVGLELTDHALERRLAHGDPIGLWHNTGLPRGRPLRRNGI